MSGWNNGRCPPRRACFVLWTARSLPHVRLATSHAAEPVRAPPRDTRRLGQPLRPPAANRAPRPRGGGREPLGDRVRSHRVLRRRARRHAPTAVRRKRLPSTAGTRVSLPACRSVPDRCVHLRRVRSRRAVGRGTRVGARHERRRKAQDVARRLISFPPLEGCVGGLVLGRHRGTPPRPGSPLPHALAT